MTEAEAWAQVVADEGLIRRCMVRYGFDPTDDDDLQDARIGWFHGCRRYDPSRGTALSTYAPFYLLRQLTRRGLQRVVTIPSGTMDLRSKLLKIRALLASLQLPHDDDAVISAYRGRRSVEACRIALELFCYTGIDTDTLGADEPQAVAIDARAIVGDLDDDERELLWAVVVDEAPTTEVAAERGVHEAVVVRQVDATLRSLRIRYAGGRA